MAYQKSLREVLAATAQSFYDKLDIDGGDSDEWTAIKHKGVEFDINVWLDEPVWRVGVYVVFDGDVDTSVTIPLGHFVDNKFQFNGAV